MEVKLKDNKSNVLSTVSWVSLASMLRKANRLKDDEHITHVEMKEHGVTYGIGKDTDA